MHPQFFFYFFMKKSTEKFCRYKNLHYLCNVRLRKRHPTRTKGFFNNLIFTIMENKKFNKSEIFRNAWKMVRSFGYSLSQALKCAWANAKFIKIANERLCEFVYMKVDGTTRRAIGTLTKRYENTSGVHRPQNDAVQCYYDIDAEAWRSFRKRNLLQIIR